MYQLILIIHVLAAVCLILLVLVQQGKGATMGAAFGSGASQTVFGSRGSGSFLLKVTIGFVLIFFTTSIFLNRMVSVNLKRVNQVTLPMQIPGQAVTPNHLPSVPDGSIEKKK